MLIIKHRVNTIAELGQIPPDFGIETDVRCQGNILILNHEPFVSGENFEEFLRNYRHSLLIVNIKCEGIEKQVIQLLEKYDVKEYFLLDVSFPFIIKLIDNGVRKLAVRFSEYESINTVKSLSSKVDWVFVDVMTKLPLSGTAHKYLADNFKICLVSPELFGRPQDIEVYQKKMGEHRLDAVLTKLPQRWEKWRI